MPRLTATYDWKSVVYQLRTQRNESQVDFASAVGCSESTVSKWEQGRSEPQPRHRRRLEELGSESQYPPNDWPLADNQEQLFGNGRSS